MKLRWAIPIIVILLIAGMLYANAVGESDLPLWVKIWLLS